MNLQFILNNITTRDNISKNSKFDIQNNAILI